MLAKLFEWYRMADLSPANDVLEARKATVSEVVKTLQDSKDATQLFACAAIAVMGFESPFSRDNAMAPVIIDAIVKPQPAFPRDLTDNAMAVRACATIALGEVVARRIGTTPQAGIAASALLVAALSFRPTHQDRFVAKALEELATIATKACGDVAAAIRARKMAQSLFLHGVAAPADLPNAWKTLIDAIQARFDQYDQHAASDREELNVLWWLQTGFCDRLKKAYKDLAPEAAVLACPADLADLVQAPVGDNIRHLVRQAMSSGRPPSDLAAQSLEQVVAGWRPEVLAALPPLITNHAVTINKFPCLFPLLWTALRVRDSGVSTGWFEEFKLKTGLAHTLSYGPHEWAVQFLNEIIAIRICSEPYSE